ncbi:type I polyketide synthase [Nonomuraea sp. NPDC005692]|uniref:type I polyketide synthase n=1 Tax=Nonomuraea sp. NPDC005692 TaxID=3157168 RepID=UPI0033E1E049
MSGIAGTIKAVQALRQGQIPPNLNWRAWNPAIPLDEESRLFVPTELIPWPVAEGPRQAAVCSYGITGTNAHIVLEQAPPAGTRPRATARAPRRHEETTDGRGPRTNATGRDTTAARPPSLFPLSASSQAALGLAAGRLGRWLEHHPADGEGAELRDVAHTLALRRSHAPFRLAAVARDAGELAAKLKSFAASGEADGLVAGTAVLPAEHQGPVFVFTGQGSQWAGMGRALLATEPAFADAIDALEPLIAAESGFSLHESLSERAPPATVGRIQPVLFALQVALAELWRSWGVRPAAVIGQSMGEAAAAVVAGALTPAEGVAVICRRSALLGTVTGGAMASVLLPAGQVADGIARAGADQVSVAVMSADDSTVISGDPAQIGLLIASWRKAGVPAAEIKVDVASHSPYMDPILGRLETMLKDLRPRSPQLAFYSTVADAPRRNRPMDAGYWRDNLRQVVRFSAATEAALADGHRLFIECSPHPLALRAVADIAEARQVCDAVTVSTLRRDTDDQETFLTSLGVAHCAGFPVEWASRYALGELAELPTGAWNRERHGGDGEPYRLVAPHLVGADQHPLLGGHVKDPRRPHLHIWQTPISPRRLPWLGDHLVAGVPVLAGAGIAEMMLSAARQALGRDQIALREVTLLSPLLLDPEPTVTTCLTLREDGEPATVEVVSGEGENLQVHAHATAGPLDGPPPPTGTGDAGDDWQESPPQELYKRLRERHQIYHGPAFAGLERTRIHPEHDVAVATLRLDDSARVTSWMMALHPVLTDEFVQAVASVWLARHAISPGPVVVAGFEEIRVYGPTAHARRARVLLHEADDLASTSSGVLMNADDTVVAEIRGLRLANVTPPDQRYADRLSHIAWVPAKPAGDDVTGQAGPKARPGSWLVLTDRATVDAAWPRELSQHLSGSLARRTPGQNDRCRLAALPHDLDTSGAGAEPAVTLPALDDMSDLSGVVLALGGSTGDRPTAPPLAARERVARLTRLIRRLAELPDPPRLWIASHQDGPTPATAGPRGVLRAAAYELPQLTASIIDSTSGTDLAEVAADILVAHPVIEISWRDGVRHVAHLRAGSAEEPAAGSRPPVWGEASYLISGGLTGLGLATAQWLAAQGADHLILVGRSAPSGEAEKTLARLRESGTVVTVVQGDIADSAVTARATAAAGDRPLLGVIHAAGVVEDAALANADEDLLHRVWRGKAEGAWALHTATTGQDLDFFVLYSSVASLIGSPGQSMYAAANTFLDDLADWRAARGLPATAIHWGAWARTGRGQHLADRGFVMISPEDGTDALGRILTAGHTRVAYSPIEADAYAKGFPAVAASELLAELGRTGDDSDRALLDEILAAETDGRRTSLIQEHIITLTRQILGGTSQHIGPGTSLVILGLDSLGAVRLRAHLENSLKTTIDPGVIWVRPTPAGLTEWILNRMGLQPDRGTDA